MNIDFERNIFRNGYATVVGIDEAGRGACAGPIVAGAVAFDNNILNELDFINDIRESKKLNEKKREGLYNKICEKALSYSVGIVDAAEIDEINIGKANHLCIYKSLENLSVKPEYITCDFVHNLIFETPYQIFKKGDDHNV